MKKLIAITTAAIVLTGCASITNDTSQPVKVVTKTAAGQVVDGAECKFQNDKAYLENKSGNVVPLRRSNVDMQVTCAAAGQPEAKATLISRVNAGLAGNIIFGGGVGAVIDHSRGTAYTYPTWVELIFGQFLVFDRKNEKEGAPTPVTVPEVKEKK